MILTIQTFKRLRYNIPQILNIDSKKHLHAMSAQRNKWSLQWGRFFLVEEDELFFSYWGFSTSPQQGYNIECKKPRNNKQLAGDNLALCIAMAPSLPWLAGFVVQSLSVAMRYQLANTKDVGNLECSYSWRHFRTLHKYLGRQSWKNYWFFLTP